MDAFCISASKELAARLLALVIPATPVGDYPANTAKLGGTLRRGWTAKTHKDAASGSGGASAAAGREYGQSLTVTKNGDVYEIVVANPVEYAPYVEFGHRTPNGKGWVLGRFFLTEAEMRLERNAEGYIQKKLEKMLREVFENG